MRKCLFILAVTAVLLSAVSCGTKTVIEYRDRDVNHYITNYVHDTLVEKTSDSVYVNVYARNDTVFSEKYKYVTRWRDRVVEKSDTCWRDSVVTEYKETVKEVVRYPKTYWVALGISLLTIVYIIYRLARWLKMF